MSANESAFPVPLVRDQIGNLVGRPESGLTKREWFAGLAMQSFISMIEGSAATVDELREVAAVTALTSTLFADALLAELAKEPAP